jgi:hypothetical protein
LATKLLAEGGRLAGFRRAALKDVPGPDIGGHEIIREAERR